MSFSLHKVGLLKRKDVGGEDVTFFWVAPPHSMRNASDESQQEYRDGFSKPR
jgi:hypothetical protein